MNKRLVIIQAAGLGYDFLNQTHHSQWNGLQFRPIESVFPALTCTAQATFRTGTPVSGHGMVANGLFHRDLHRPLLWEQSSALVAGPRIWDSFRKRKKRVAMLFWQQSLGEDVDFVLSPTPVHKHGGGLIQDVYSKPAGLYESLCKKVGGKFKLHRYWGPIASPASSAWIARATAALLGDSSAPDLCLTYLPALDYDLQRHGPDHASAKTALKALLDQIAIIRESADRNGYDVIIFGDYAIGPVSEAVFPNRALHAAGLFQTRTVAGMLYPDFHNSTAFAMVDHEIAHVYINPTKGDPTAVQTTLAGMPGIARILGPHEQQAAGIAHPHGGNLMLEANPGAWFAYPWWTSGKEAPDYATHVDIHNKPGYDPCELFFGWPPLSVSQDTSRIRGSHGRIGEGRGAAWASTCNLPETPHTLLDLARIVRQSLEAMP